MLKEFFFFLLKQTVILIVTVFVVLLAVRIHQESSGPELKPWHTTVLENEFNAQRTDVPDFKSYLDLEKKLFQEMDDKIVSHVPPEDQNSLDRYYRTAISNPANQRQNWDRSFVSIPLHPKGAVVLIHGLSDSPYSMHGVAELFIKQGYAVFVPRMPGHGTIPAGLIYARWPDWVAATHLACVAARQSIAPGQPLIVGGYSNGGLLAVKYTLDEIALGKTGQPPQKLILFAPAIGITEFAAFSSWYQALTIFPYFKKINWLSIQPEYDPYKYNSFPKMAGDQIFKLSKVVEKQLNALEQQDAFSAFPPVLTFTSVVDSTVLTPELVTRFYSKLKSNGSELVLYDVNRGEYLSNFINDKHDAFLTHLTTGPALPYTLALITNQKPNSFNVMAHVRTANTTTWVDEDLKMQWPRGVYSLSHLAIPNSSEDPLYGNRMDLRDKGDLVLGLLQPRGETNVLDIPASQFLRIRFNPFFEHLKTTIVRFITASRAH